MSGWGILWLAILGLSQTIGCDSTPKPSPPTYRQAAIKIAKLRCSSGSPGSVQLGWECVSTYAGMYLRFIDRSIENDVYEDEPIALDRLGKWSSCIEWVEGTLGDSPDCWAVFR